MISDLLTQLLPKDTPDSYFLSLAFRLKSRIPKPPQSKFRVFSIITFRDETIPSDSIGYLFGTNSETCVLSNCICAERSALVQLKLRPTSSLVDKVFIVCDSQVYITPGPLCREYMMDNFCSENTIIITCGENQVPRQFTLGQLLPFPMIYLQIDRDNVLSYAKEFSQKCEQFLTKYNKTHPKWITLYKNMLSLARRERKIFLHPINYVAGVLFSDNQTVISQHHEAIEYGCSLDAVSRLTVFIERESKATPQLILQVDQYGTLHAPAAVARAYLEEKGYHSVNFVIHDKNGKLQLLRGSELMPYGAKSVDLVGKSNL